MGFVSTKGFLKWMQSALEREAVVPVPLLPPVSGLDNGTLFVLALERGSVWGCIFWRHTHQTR